MGTHTQAPPENLVDPPARNTVLTALLRELRLAAGLTQAEAGVAIDLTQTGVSDFETGDRGLELQTVRHLVRAYGADWADFIAELSRRLASATPAKTLIRKGPLRSGQ